MKSKYLHIVSFDIPYPANYGGIIDVYYKLKNLSASGVKIILHCYKYNGKEKQKHLEELCEQVFYYPRLKTNGILNLISKPYIVGSRKNKSLLKNLQLINAPILFEGLHTCFYLNHSSLSNRFKMVRMHNIEWEYYQHLALNEQNILKRFYYKIESILLKRFEQTLKNSNCIFAISENDFNYLDSKFDKVKRLNVIHENELLTCKIGQGAYNLYHGNLSVSENVKAAEYLIDIYKSSNFEKPLIIAGKNPSNLLIRKVNSLKNIELKTNLNFDEMNNLIENAQINILPTFQETGVKLKLINALYKGRFCLVNPQMLSGTNLKNTCEVATNQEEFIKKISVFSYLKFDEKDISKRKKILSKYFNNKQNIEAILNLL